MKKIVALALMLCMLCGCAAMAEDMEQLLALSWDELTPYLSDMGLVGDFDALDLIGLKLFIPTSLVKAEVSEADAQAGRLAAYASAAGDNGFLVVDAVNLGELTVDQWFEMVNSNEAMSDVRMDNMNGLTVVMYKNVVSDLWVCSLVDTNSNIITFSMGPASEDGSEFVFNLLMKSLQAIE